MLPASFVQTERFWCNAATYVINLCVDWVLFSLIEFINLVGAGGHTQKGICNLHNEFKET